jgi:hypothetical protein
MNSKDKSRRKGKNTSLIKLLENNINYILRFDLTAWTIELGWLFDMV